jgi:superfamily I DNA and RNA helicase
MTVDPRESRVVPLGIDGVELVTRYFANSFTLPRPVGASLQCDETQIRFLTDQQISILGALEHQRRMAIPGPAGTGKTALAVAKALRAASSGKRTVLLCYNRALAAQLRLENGSVPNLTISTYHALCQELAKGVPGALAAEPSSPDYYTRHLPSALRRALDVHPEERFDAVIIDEGQDFEDGWYDAIEALLRDPAESILYVFYDDNQRVHFRTAAITSHFPTSPVRLTRIVRNARQIVRVIDPLLPSPYDAAGPDGIGVRYVEARGELGEEDIARELKRLIRQDHVQPCDIAVLVPDEKFRRRVVRSNRIAEWPVRDAEAPPGVIVCETVRRFKGLERSVVLVCEPEAIIGEPAVLYVALTRPRLLLTLMGSRGRLRQIRDLLPADPV